MKSRPRIMLRLPASLGLWITAILTSIVGLVNLASAVMPGSPERIDGLGNVFPFEARAGGYLFSAIAGFLLLTLAGTLLRRKRLAWIMAVCLLVVSIISHLIKGFDYEEALLAAILLGQLWLTRRLYTAPSDRPSLVQGIRVLVGALLFTLVYGTLGFFLLDRHYAHRFSLAQALGQTLAMFFSADNGGLLPTHRFGRFFANSIYTVGATTLLYAVWMCLRPVIFRPGTYPRLVSQADVTVALVRADSDDQRGDYFSTQFLRTALTQGGKRLSKFLPLGVSLLLFGLSIWGVGQQLHRYNPEAILASLREIPGRGLLLSLGFTALNYLFLTGYDALATRYVNQPLPYRKIALVSVISYALSNSIGMALLSGGAIRYRFYHAWGFSAGKIAQIITFCNLSFWIGLLAVGGMTFSVNPLTVPQSLRLPFASIHPVGYGFLILTIAYLMWSAIATQPLRLKRWVLPHLPFHLSTSQVVITTCDWILAAAVLYVLLPNRDTLPFFVFFGTYLLAQITGIVSSVPGGLGVFEGILILLLSPPLDGDRLLGSLLAYRGIYYFLPLFCGAALFALYELRQRYLLKVGNQ